MPNGSRFRLVFPSLGDIDWLRHQYEDLGKSQAEIADGLGCTKSAVWSAMRRLGLETRPRGHLTGMAHPNWKGGKSFLGNGYVRILIDGEHVGEHRHVMAQHLGRSLARHETVHHINGNRADNRLENLQLRIGQHGAGQAYRCADCGSDRLIQERLS